MLYKRKASELLLHQPPVSVRLALNESCSPNAGTNIGSTAEDQSTSTSESTASSKSVISRSITTRPKAESFPSVPLLEHGLKRRWSAPHGSHVGLLKESSLVRCLGWDGLMQPADELLSALCCAFDGAGVSYVCHEAQLSIEISSDALLATASVVTSQPGQHAITFKRVKGDTFQFHSLYRKLREAMASTTGWVCPQPQPDRWCKAGGYASFVRPIVSPLCPWGESPWFRNFQVEPNLLHGAPVAPAPVRPVTNSLG